MRSEDDEIALMFDDVKRSNAVHKLTAWHRNGLMSDEDLKEFSAETQETIHFLNQIER